jgi:hypothetical protein
MKRQISSKITFISKIGVPSFVLFGWATAIFALLFDSSKDGQLPIPLPVKILFPAIFFVIFAVLFWLSMRLKAVSIDDNFLYISNYLKEVSVPFSNVRDITELRLRGHPVTIHFKEKTEFGSKITFLPKMRFFNFASSHPVVSELKELAKIKNE